ncbi:DUF4276 family protein [Dyadobacter sp. CY312]|uniref:DUF4276 family protein n=1 Tax=Dyadobacter sp. CY312 TaxID=2907303 RepID=UPI001F415AB0|nr:DUF4276 family protein [Dyadobacter sp. CY312]MCE7041740.1 DUF4276 family protein [Dyadobacter sp. CY312]
MASKAILFLYEGETEGEFYPLVFKSKLERCAMKFSKQCLEGNFNINSKVANEIYNFINKNKNTDLHVFVALDRDKPKLEPPPIDTENIIKTVGSKHLKTIELIVATQDFESWLFIEIDNIYKHLRAPKSKRVPHKYKNYEGLNHLDMSKLFKTFGHQYQKGKRVEGLLKNLNIDNIYDTCTDLQNGIKAIAKLYR